MIQSTKIIGTGKCVPSRVIKNDDFLNHTFYDAKGEKISNDIADTIQKFYEITNIKERVYVTDDLCASDIALKAAEQAIENAGIDVESLDAILVGHNFGDIHFGSTTKDIVPALAARVKNMLKIEKPSCIAHDVISGCPAWVQAFVIAEAYIKSGFAKRVLIIGADTISRALDYSDRDSMIFADGAGATIVEGSETKEREGFISHAWRTDANMNKLLWMGKGFKTDESQPLRNNFVKMQGHKLYLYAQKYTPLVVKEAIDKSGYDIGDVKKLFIHQANEKLDDAILKGVGELYGTELPKTIMPMTIGKWGNSGAATVPMLMDAVLRGELEGHEVSPGDVCLIASLGAGMSINVIVYKF